MFASVFPQLPARLRRALILVKAFAFLEDPLPARPAPSPAPAPGPAYRAVIATTTPAGGGHAAGHPACHAACHGDRRRGPGTHRVPRPQSAVKRCATALSGAGRSGRAIAPPQRCATPTTASKRPGELAAPKDRRASVPGGFLHR
jgi:hypothetical protein